MLIKHLNIEATNICNQNCFYCFNESGPSSIGITLSPKQWKEKLVKLKDKGLESVHLTGGEPFAYKNIIELIQSCQDLDLKTSILSNGLKISNYSDKYPQLFKNLTVAQISLDSLDKDKHNKRRGFNKAYSDATTAISSLSNLNVPLEISMTIDNDNVNDIPDMIHFANKNNAKLILRPLISKGRAKNIIESTIKEKIKLFSKDDITIQDRFCYVTDLPINDKHLLDSGFLTTKPSSDIDSVYLNNNNIHTINDLIAV